MERVYILFILISACAHAFYNFLMHSSGGSRLFLLIMFFIAAGAANISFLFSNASITISFIQFIQIYTASAFYVLYQIAVSKSYEKGEISRLYPLTVLSPMFVPIWAGFFLNERIVLLTIIGIIITVIGAIIIKQKHISLRHLKTSLAKENSYHGAGYALLASVFYSIGSVIDKSSIMHFSLSPYLWILLSCMAFNMLIFNLIIDKNICSQIRSIHILPVISAGLIAYISFYTFRVALQHVNVSIAVPIRVSSVIFAVLLGLFFGKELISQNKIIGISTIIIGILIINSSI
ncbi:MAG: EamA family transporter [Bacteroidales bacterium]